MTAIVTVTLNPAVDLSTAVERIVPVHKMRGTSQRHDPGGGGINVARVVARLGGDVSAIYLAGGAMGDLLRRLLEGEGIAGRALPIAGETREDFFVDETSTGQQYRFILPGPRLAEHEWKSCLAAVAGLDPFPRFLVASGSLPDGVPDDFYAQLARIAKPRGASVILDTSGAALAAAVAEGVDLIKPNLREMRELSGGADTPAAWEVAAERLIDGGGARIVALTMGHLGAALVTSEGILRARPLTITPRSAGGAGDSFQGALVFGLAAGNAPADCFRSAVAAGAAALLHPGTELCRPDDVARLTRDVVIERD
ncbi:1-phosphofructokinase family hexose kinase [Bradyrhizobium sp.]|uniref:1-phosphofructokinase family hexose kinase n=1 Tax=Bradyrhizobium sp. TaxID=376 RepID=UPI004037AB8E